MCSLRCFQDDTASPCSLFFLGFHCCTRVLAAFVGVGQTSVMYLNAGLDNVNVTSKSGTRMPFYATNLVPYGGSFQYWMAAMPEMVVGGVNLCEGQGCAAVMDSGTSLWTVPGDLWEGFLEAVLTPSGCEWTLARRLLFGGVTACFWFRS